MNVPEPDDYDDASLSSETAGTLRTIANVLGVMAGLLFLLAFGIGLVQHDEVKLLYFSFGILFLLFPLLLRSRTRSGT